MKIGFIFLFFSIFTFFNVYSQREIIRKYYNDGKLEFEEDYLGNKAYGIWRSYYENGNIKIETDVLNDTKKTYYESGKLKSHTYIDKDNFRKIIKTYDEDGNLMSIGIFNNFPKFSGIEKHYDKDKKLIFRYTYRDGKLVGIEKIKHEKK
ncbi:MAG: hypothetical protein NC918_04445 [Candidatus Omnitrophica bacterium]|nr:hypothetical protein [Candidatus Omnitrophota bacterium]